MKPILTFLLIVLFALSSEARLGDSLKELKRRYGQSGGSENTKDERAVRYSFYWEQYVINATLQDGLSVSEEFTRQNGRDFTLPEVRYLLQESTPGLSWTQVDGSTWKQRDRVATWSGKALVVQEKALAK